MSRTVSTWGKAVKHCVACGKLLKLNNARDLQRKRFCSKECNGRYHSAKLNTPAARARRDETGRSDRVRKLKGHKGVDNPNWKGGSVTRSCQICGQPFVVKRDRATTTTYGKYCSKACFYAWQASGAKRGARIAVPCTVCGKLSHDTPARAKTRVCCSTRCVAVLSRRSLKRESTDIARILVGIVTDLGFNFEVQRNIGTFTTPDVFIAPNYAIYADGDYWHNIPEVKSRDMRINDRLILEGYKVLRFTGKELKYTPDIVRSAINQAVRG